MIKNATISECTKYRYQLTRSWKNEGEKDFTLLFIMLNPSTADAMEDDPTIRKCITIAKAFHFNSIEVVNLYGYRSTDPSTLLSMSLEEAQGELNGHYVAESIGRANAICVAWGNQGQLGTFQMTELLKGKGVLSLAVNKGGSPKHPLYCKNSSTLTDYKIRQIK